MAPSSLGAGDWMDMALSLFRTSTVVFFMRHVQKRVKISSIYPLYIMNKMYEIIHWKAQWSLNYFISYWVKSSGAIPAPCPSKTPCPQWPLSASFEGCLRFPPALPAGEKGRNTRRSFFFLAIQMMWRTRQKCGQPNPTPNTYHFAWKDKQVNIAPVKPWWWLGRLGDG